MLNKYKNFSEINASQKRPNLPSGEDSICVHEADHDHVKVSSNWNLIIPVLL